MDIDWQNVAGILQQKIANMTAQYEGQIAVLTAQLNTISEQFVPSEDAEPKEGTVEHE